MSGREVVLEGGPPWGFRMTGGLDMGYPLKISRVNRGSKAAEHKVREGDLILCINGRNTVDVSNQEAHQLIRSSGNSLNLILLQKSRDRRKDSSIERKTSHASLDEGGATKDGREQDSDNQKPETEVHKSNGIHEIIPEQFAGSKQIAKTKTFVENDDKLEDSGKLAKNSNNDQNNDDADIKERLLKKSDDNIKVNDSLPETSADDTKIVPPDQTDGTNVLDRNNDKSLKNIKFTFLHHKEDKAEMSLPLPTTPESVFFKVSKQRRLSNSSQGEEKEEDVRISSVSGQVARNFAKEDILDQTLSPAQPHLSDFVKACDSPSRTVGYEPLYSGKEQRRRQKEWEQVCTQGRKSRLKYSIIRSILEKGARAESGQMTGRKGEKPGKRKAGSVGGHGGHGGRLSPFRRAEESDDDRSLGSSQNLSSVDLRKGVGRIEDYVPTDEEVSTTVSTPDLSTLDLLPSLAFKHNYPADMTFDGDLMNSSSRSLDTLSEDSLNSEPQTCDKPKKMYVHEILRDGEGETSLVIRKSGKPTKPKKSELRNIKKDYRSIQQGGDIPRTGFGRRPLPTGRSPSVQLNQYGTEEVYIHYKAPINREQKENVPEEVMQLELERKMLKVYEEMARKKIADMEEDYEKRRHSDNSVQGKLQSFTVVQYKNIINKQSNEEQAIVLRARALYNFRAERRGELEFSKGNILTVVGRVDENWLEGQIQGRRGIFPTSMVEIIQDTGLRLIAKHNFRGKNEGELTIIRGEILQFERWVDENWVEVSLGERSGIVPLVYLQQEDQIRSWEEEVLSLATTPSTPERPKHPDVLVEHVYRPTDILKSKLREEFKRRERDMRDLEIALEVTTPTRAMEVTTPTRAMEGTTPTKTMEGTNFIKASPRDGTDLSQALDISNLTRTECRKTDRDIDTYAQKETMEMEQPNHKGKNQLQNSKYEDDILYNLDPRSRQMICECTVGYNPCTEVEVALRPGDKVLILQDFYDGWMAGRLLDSSNKIGLFPARCVRQK